MPKKYHIWGIQQSFHQRHERFHLFFWPIQFYEFQKDLDLFLCIDFIELMVVLQEDSLVVVHPGHDCRLLREVIWLYSCCAPLLNVHQFPSVPALYQHLTIISLLHKFFHINLCHVWSWWALRLCGSLIGQPSIYIWVGICRSLWSISCWCCLPYRWRLRWILMWNFR